MKYGLEDSHLSELTAILASIPHIERASLYGSRARGDYKAGSDIDLCLYGDGITRQDLTSLSDKLYESRIPYFFDVVVWQKLHNASFMENIERDGKDIYNK